MPAKSAPAASLTWSEVWARRLAAHSLDRRAPAAELEAVVGAVCGIHAQVMAAAELSIGVRAGVVASDVRRALWEERRLVKVHGIRGTLHLFPAAELPLWMAAARARRVPGEERWLAEMGLTPAQVEAIVEAVGAALEGRRLTQKELGLEVVARAGEWAGEATAPAWGGRWPRWRVCLGYAAAAGHLCFGPDEGRQVTYVRPADWLGPAAALEPEAALAEVLRRYLRAYGPALPREFAQWYNLDAADARAVAAALGEELVEVEVEGQRRLWTAAALAAPAPEPGDSIRLLPHFDAYLRGCHPRSLLAAGWPGRTGGGTGQIPVLLAGGVVGGIWDHRARGGRVLVFADPFVELSPDQRAQLDAEAARVGEVLELPSELSLTSLSLRPHL
jgi:hypothetical protein